MNQQKINEVCKYYCSNEMKKLKEICYPIIKKFGGLSGADFDDFYSIANKTVWDSARLFDWNQNDNFEAFLKICIERKFRAEMTKRNRFRRIPSNLISSLDVPISEGEDITLGETISSNFNVEKEVVDEGVKDEVVEYLNTLTPTQKEIAKLIMNGYSIKEIKNMINISPEQFKKAWEGMCSYEKKRILYQEKGEVEMNIVSMPTKIDNVNIEETYKNTSYSIDSISKQLKRRKLRDNHILQRQSGQWKPFAKSELISDVLRGKSLTQIIISEEIKNGVKMCWLIDGKQRCTTLDDYLHDGFAISKNVTNYNIVYQTTKLDKNGDEIFNEDGFPIIEFKEFDIRGKKFSQLPVELQDIFCDRQIPVLYNMNCTKKDIADDIARFNRSRPMNKAQNGWLGLDEEYAEFVDNISKMPFFQPDFTGSSYTNNNHKAGDIRRIIVEGIIVSKHPEGYNKNFEKMCEYLSLEASDTDFTTFYSYIDRIQAIANENISKMFNKRDSFIWFGLFTTFDSLKEKYHCDDIVFARFLDVFNKKLHGNRIQGVSFDDLCINPETGKALSNKDKSIIEAKLTLLKTLLENYMSVNVLKEAV